jgi:hypothetical protein
MKKLVRNYDADYYIDGNGEVSDSGTIKKYAIAIENEYGDVVEWTSADSEGEAQAMIKQSLKDVSIQFTYQDIQYNYTITPDEADFWFSVDVFDIHYCEEYNEVCVYLQKDYTLKTIHKQRIKPLDSISYEDVVNVCNILNKDLSVEEMEEVLKRYNESYEDDLWSAILESIIYHIISERNG